MGDGRWKTEEGKGDRKVGGRTSDWGGGELGECRERRREKGRREKREWRLEVCRETFMFCNGTLQEWVLLF
jgi:hypothetical protein